MVQAPPTYAPRRPTQGVLARVVRDHFETFRARAATLRDGDGLPRFVEQEFRDFLGCGSLAGGFARFRCGECGLDRLVPFSCKGRAVCPSCGARRMADRAAHLVDHVLPPVPVRQWVLTLPYRLRYLLAWHHDLCRAVVGVFMRSVLGFQRRAAKRSCVANGLGGGVAVVQRFGRALNLNVHVHALVLDGVFVTGADGVAFAPADELSDLEVAEVLATVVPGIEALLARRGYGADDEEGSAPDVFAEDAPALAGMAAAAVHGTTAVGQRAGARTRRCGEEIEHAGASLLPRCHARQDGFDLEAGVRVRADQRDRLDRLCRYVLRPPVADERLRLLDDGDVLLALERRWSDGTTHLRFSPVELLERLAVLIPRPRINLLLYHGVLGPRAAAQSRIVAFGKPEKAGATTDRGAGPVPADGTHGGPPGGRRWADLMRRSYGLDVLACPRCGGRLRLVALIEDRLVIARILTHLRLPTDVPAPRPGRAPPCLDEAASA
jgi:hypothetical protein